MKKILLALVVTVGFAAPANAAGITLGQLPPSNLIVTAGGLEWVWAGPCAPVNPSCGVAQLHNGFVVPTTNDWNASWPSLAALVAAFDNPQLCSSPYFNTVHNHCDSGDLVAGAVWGAPFSGIYFDNPAAEAFLVRGVVVDPHAAVPEPGTMVLLGTGLAVAGYRLRRRK